MLHGDGGAGSIGIETYWSTRVPVQAIVYTTHVYTGIYTRVHVYRYCNSMPSDKYNTGTGTRVPIPVSTYFQYTCTRTCVLTVQYYIIMPCPYGCVPVPGTYACRYGTRVRTRVCMYLLQ